MIDSYQAPSPPFVKRKPILCLDFDGVIHSYSSGWQDADIIPDPPVPGSIQFMIEAVNYFDVHILSSRSHQEGGVAAMQQWLIKSFASAMNCDMSDEAMRIHVARFCMETIKWPKEKPPASVTIDDRALTFTGNWHNFPMRTLLEFQPWNKRKPKPDSNMIAWARAELSRVNFGEEDTGVMLKIMRTFLDQWDSGGAVAAVVPILHKLMTNTPLSPLTGDDDEWMEIQRSGPFPVYQNKRDYSVFKSETGRCYDIDTPGRPTITFPYDPEVKVIDPVTIVDTTPRKED